LWGIIAEANQRESQIRSLVERFNKKGRIMPAQVGDTAPEFTLPSVSEGDISLSQYRGQKHVVLSFHVFDFTSG